jgi:hypothetical protein
MNANSSAMRMRIVSALIVHLCKCENSNLHYQPRKEPDLPPVCLCFARWATPSEQNIGLVHGNSAVKYVSTNELYYGSLRVQHRTV